MKQLTLKQSQRLEKKKKKMAAFLEIAKLNDKDREAKETKQQAREETTSESSSDSDTNSVAEKMPHDGPSRKRAKKCHDLDEPLEATTNSIERPEPVEANSCTFSTPITHESEPVGPNGQQITDISEEDYIELRRRLRERKRLFKKMPLIRLKQIGDMASIDLGEDARTPLFLSDIQHLLLYSILGNNAPYNPLAWCHIEKARSISQTVLLLVEDISLYDFQAYQSCFPNLTRCFSIQLEVITPSAYNGNFIEELSLVPLTLSKEKMVLKKHGNLEAALRSDGDLHKVLRAVFPVLETDNTGRVPVFDEDTEMIVQYPSLAHKDQFPRTHLIMSVPQLIDQGYPLPLKGPLKNKFKNYIFTKDLYSEVTPKSPMFALDCEMCMTTAKELELTRISIVDEHLKCIYDTLVLPYNRIVNYLTMYSGITREMLVDVTTRLEDVQEDLRQLLPTDAIIVGQSLNGDLHTLRMMHPYIIDTSVIFNMTGNYKRKSKLKVMAMKFLGEEIQSNSEGHCSTEDSEACMKLVQLKLANNLAFGDTILANRQPEFRSMTQSLVTMANPEIMAAWQETLTSPSEAVTQPPLSLKQEYSSHPKEDYVASTMFNFFRHHEKSVAIVSVRSIIDEYSTWINARLTGSSKKNKKAVNCITATSMENVIHKVGSAASKHALTLGHLLYNGEELDQASNKESVFREIDSWCGQVWENLASNALCLIMFGGRQGGANGVCFMRIKRRDTIHVNQD